MDNAQIIAFVLASLVIIATPGQDMVLVMSRAVSQGAWAGIVTAAGVSVGLLGHTLLTAFGLGSLLMASALLFNILKFVGAAYLIYLGIRLLMSKSSELDLQESQLIKPSKLFAQGAFSNISNPKVTIFYFAFLPQFISADVANVRLGLLLLGISFAALTFIVKMPIGYFAGRLSGWLKARPNVLQWLDRISGAVIIGLGIKLAFEKR